MTNDYENTLRHLILNIIGGADNARYLVPDSRIEKWKEKREIETKKNKGISYEPRLIYYSDFYDLATIIIKNWELFKPVLIDKKRFEVFFSEVENFRNTIAHGRNLTLSQESLLHGITSDLKSLITIYHNKNEMKEDYFIRLTKINDNLGNVWDEDHSPKTKPVLRVGDEYELFIEANDPKGREIEYEISKINSTFEIKGTSPRITFKVTNDLVSSSQMFLIQVRTPQSEYTNSDLRTIHITILPK
jgi:hypothetical protein